MMRCHGQMMPIRAYQIALMMLVIAACKKGDEIPSYLEIPNVTVSTTTAQGSSTSNITDVWVSVNDEFLGVWELPARIPALYEGLVEVRVVPAIKRNGMYDDRLRYPFYTPFIQQVELSKNASVNIQPVVEHLAVTSFWIESFDDPGTLLNLSANSDTVLLRRTPAEYPDIVLDNTPCGAFILDQEHPFIQVYTDEDFEVNGGPVFLELDYRSDIQFTVGVKYNLGGFANSEPYVYVAPTTLTTGATQWNKIYIDLSPVFNLAVSQRDIFLQASLPEGSSSAAVYFDNIKLLRIVP